MAWDPRETISGHLQPHKIGFWWLEWMLIGANPPDPTASGDCWMGHWSAPPINNPILGDPIPILAPVRYHIVLNFINFIPHFDHLLSQFLIINRNLLPVLVGKPGSEPMALPMTVRNATSRGTRWGSTWGGKMARAHGTLKWWSWTSREGGFAISKWWGYQVLSHLGIKSSAF